MSHQARSPLRIAIFSRSLWNSAFYWWFAPVIGGWRNGSRCRIGNRWFGGGICGRSLGRIAPFHTVQIRQATRHTLYRSSGNSQGNSQVTLSASGAVERKGKDGFSVRERKSMMRRLLIVFLLSAVPASASADRTEWRRYAIPSTGASVDIPVSIFTEDAGPPEGGTGRRFFTKDRRADLTLQSVPNPEN